MRSRTAIMAALLCGLSLATALAQAPPTVEVRVGSHPGYGRVVFDLPPRTEYRLTQQGPRASAQHCG